VGSTPHPSLGIVAGMTTSTSTTAPVAAPRWRRVLHRWPSVLGLAAAVLQLATGGERETVVIVVCVATLCYLGAAALQMPWVAWAGIAGGSLVVVASELVGLVWWAGIGIVALVLVVVGLLGRAPRPALTAQTAALAGYGGLAVAALYFAPRVGLVLAGLVLASHAVWDLIHYRRNRVVPRSLAEFCMLLDVPLGVGVIVLAVIG
jgi:hypothetical protein